MLEYSKNLKNFEIMKNLKITLLCLLLCGCSTLKDFNQEPVKSISTADGEVNVVLSTPYALAYELGSIFGYIKPSEKIKFSVKE